MLTWFIVILAIIILPFVMGYAWDLAAPRRLQRQRERMEESRKRQRKAA